MIDDSLLVHFKEKIKIRNQNVVTAYIFIDWCPFPSSLRTNVQCACSILWFHIFKSPGMFISWSFRVKSSTICSMICLQKTKTSSMLLSSTMLRQWYFIHACYFALVTLQHLIPIWHGRLVLIGRLSLCAVCFTLIVLLEIKSIFTFHLADIAPIQGILVQYSWLNNTLSRQNQLSFRWTAVGWLILQML